MMVATRRIEFDEETTREAQLRIDLAAAFRLAARFGWNESVANHFSAATSLDGRRFLMNPKWVHFEEMKPASLQLFNSDSVIDPASHDAPDPSAWAIHAMLHESIPLARVALHVHPKYATAIASLDDPSIPPIDQATARFYGQVALDLSFGGLANEEAEGHRIAAALGDKRILLMRNHGVLVIGDTVAHAFEDLYLLERACRTLVLAYSTGKKLCVMPHDLAEKTAESWLPYREQGVAHFEALKRLID
jgi:ribulose-5-phosphate 4-epimerase/fuculose-1-phosphate aldolase